jgi:hypothetical protein
MQAFTALTGAFESSQKSQLKFRIFENPQKSQLKNRYFGFSQKSHFKFLCFDFSQKSQLNFEYSNVPQKTQMEICRSPKNRRKLNWNPGFSKSSKKSQIYFQNHLTSICVRDTMCT